MPNLVCRTCGRIVYTAVPIEQLFAEERRCPRCGAGLSPERREGDRRKGERRRNPAGDPGPPGGIERRVADRRQNRRRRGEGGSFGRG
jgi:hypothetical protein